MVQANDSPAIEAKGLVKTYPNKVRALDGLDLAVAQGSIHALARAKRRREVNDGQDRDHAVAARRGQRVGSWARRCARSRTRSGG